VVDETLKNGKKCLHLLLGTVFKQVREQAVAVRLLNLVFLEQLDHVGVEVTVALHLEVVSEQIELSTSKLCDHFKI